MKNSKVKEVGAMITSLGLVAAGMGTAAVALGREGDNIKYMNYLELEKEAYQEYMDEIREEEIALYRSWKNGEISTDEYMEMLSALSLKEYLDERHHCVLTTDEVDANLSDIKKEIEECKESSGKRTFAAASGIVATFVGVALGVKSEDTLNECKEQEI